MYMAESLKWDGKSRGAKCGYVIFFWFLKAGLMPAYLLLIFVAAYYCFSEPGRFAVSYSFYRRRIGYGRIRSAASVYRNCYIFGQCLVDRVAVMAAGAKFSIEFEGESNLTFMAKQGRGALLVGAHLGNWEIAGQFMHRIKVATNILMLDNERETIKKYVKSVKKREDAFKIIPLKDDLSHLYLTTEALARGEFVCLHADRHTGKSKLAFRSFLGENAPFSGSVFRMCVLFNVPVSFVFAFKSGFGRYRFYASPPKIYSGTRDEKFEAFARDYVGQLESMTRRYPLHWFNFFDFWKPEDGAGEEK
jgi:predicted LPLAT superfamily acyltransferase